MAGRPAFMKAGRFFDMAGYPAYNPGKQGLSGVYMNHYPGGVWPVMLTPFSRDGAIDEAGLRALVDWYIANGVDGLFASCQSSEIFNMDEDERVRVARVTVGQAAGRVPVVASGHTDYEPEAQARVISRMAETGVDAVILITNRLAGEDEPDSVLLANTKRLMGLIDPGIKLGLYECPTPYKRLLSLPVIRALAETGRFYFLKDTCCDAEAIRKKQEACAGSNLKVYNANTTTLLRSLRDGAGYSGVMANFHPGLYVWLTRNPHDPRAEMVQNVLTVCSFIERQMYPVNAKYHLQAFEGLPITTVCRVRDHTGLTPTFREEVRQMDALCREAATQLGISPS